MQPGGMNPGEYGMPLPPEQAPQPPAMPGQGPGMPVPPPGQHLSRDDVAAVIAAMPGPAQPAPASAPVGSMPVPEVAADVDIIEPEWVAKAEDVVARHSGDPYGEEEAVESLQEDYLKKRYGYDVGHPNGNKPEGT